MINRLYILIRPLLFSLDPERAHNLSLKFLKIYSKFVGKIHHSSFEEGVSLLGLNFPNKVGLAAGFDKNGEYIDALSILGFGFIEVGTVTPQPQPGNKKPRLFRFTKKQAIVNCMGFNNDGVDNLIKNINKSKYTGILGINIGKNFFTKIENAADDYLFCFDKVYQYANYIVCNISSPNTENLRTLQNNEYFIDLFTKLKIKQNELQKKYNKYVPLFVKIAPDLDEQEIIELSKNIVNCKIDGVIATNTTIDKSLLAENKNPGGISGKPLFDKSNNVLKILAKNLPKDIPIIGVGGIMSHQDVKTKLDLGASLVQIYSSIIFNGPKIICDNPK